MNLASLLGGHGLQAQMTPLLGNQQCHSVTLTNLQVVELQRAVVAQKLETETQAAALVQAQIDEMVYYSGGTEEGRPGLPPCTRADEKRWGRRLVILIWLITGCAEE